MSWEEIKKPANLLSLSRIPLTIVLFFLLFYADRTVFLIVFLITALTDLFDGFVARWTKTTSKKGAFYDSIGDYAFGTGTLVMLYFLNPALFMKNFMWVVIVVVSLFAVILIGRVRYGKFILMHLWLGKLSFWSFTILAIAIIINFFSQVFFMIAIIIFLVRNLEELIIFLTHKKVDPDMKSIFIK
jgi:CDP-diacylglycerol--glycerol-3-phosphate 3-phosphatidyltransferase